MADVTDQMQSTVVQSVAAASDLDLPAAPAAADPTGASRISSDAQMQPIEVTDTTVPAAALTAVGTTTIAPSPSAIAPALPVGVTTTFDLDDDDEVEAPLGTAIGDEEDDDDASMDSSASEEDGEGKDGGMRLRRRSGFSAAALLASDSDLGSDSDADGPDTGRYSSRDLEYQREIESATACGLPYSFLHPLEQEFMPEFLPYAPLYLQVRNLICRQWQLSLTSFLTFDQFLSRSNLDEAKLRHTAKRIFDFLNVHGFINCGLLPIRHDAHDARPQEQRVSDDAVTHTPTVRRKSDVADASTNATAVAPVESSTSVKDEPMGVKSEVTSQDETTLPGADADVQMKVESDVKPTPAAVDAPNVSLTAPPAASDSTSKRIVIIGAGASGLAAARQLQSFGHSVVVLEGRSRIGGRVNTLRDKFSAPVDLGASIMTGLYGSPLNVLSKQMSGREFDVGFSTMHALGKSTVESPSAPFADLMHYIRHHCPIYTEDGQTVDKELDNRTEEMWNKLLEAEYALKVNSGHQCEPPAESKLTKAEMDLCRLADPKSVYAMDVESGLRTSQKLLGIRMTPAEQKLIDWHAANLEYGCATALNRLSLVYWDQDDGMAWEGDHALIKPGFGAFLDHLSTDVDIRLNAHVQSIAYPDSSSPSSSPSSGVRVVTRDNLSGAESVFDGDYVLCTASLGVLKAGELEFQPPLPTWKTNAISSLGFGLLNKLILEFPTTFWKTKNDQDMFGYLPPGPSQERGKFYIFWNLERSTGRPILVALCAGEAAYCMEDTAEEDLVSSCMRALRAIHSEQSVPDPIHTHQTKWSQDRYARGSYSFVAAGNNGQEYDQLAKPVGPALYFAGEACNRDYPATVPGAYLSGLRAAGQMQSHIFSWDRSSPPAGVLRELSKQKKSELPSQQARRATAVTQQAAQELHRLGGHTSDVDLKLKIAEILARQKRRRGIRHEIAVVTDETGDIKPAQEENIASKLAAAARMLKAGLFATAPREQVTIPKHGEDRYSHIKRYDGAFERPFDARKHDTQGLPELASFNDFETTLPSSHAANGADAPRAKTRRELRHEKKKRALSRDKHKSRAERSAKKHKSSSHKSKSSSSRHANAPPEKLIHRHVGKAVLRIADASVPQAVGQSALLKQVQRKAAAKVVDDWSSKPRGSLTVAEWINDKRKMKIDELVTKYLHIYSSSSSAARGSSTAPADGANGAATTDAPSASAAAPAQRQPKFFPGQQR